MTRYDLGSNRITLGSVLRINCRKNKGAKQQGLEDGCCDDPDGRMAVLTSDSRGTHRKQLDSGSSLKAGPTRSADGLDVRWEEKAPKMARRV